MAAAPSLHFLICFAVKGPPKGDWCRSCSLSILCAGSCKVSPPSLPVFSATMFSERVEYVYRSTSPLISFVASTTLNTWFSHLLHRSLFMYPYYKITTMAHSGAPTFNPAAILSVLNIVIEGTYYQTRSYNKRLFCGLLFHQCSCRIFQLWAGNPTQV